MHQIQCRCGALRGALDPVGTSNRLRCYCTDCRAFARHLGRPDEVLDAQGGTEIVQVAPSRLRFTEGLEQLAIVRLRPKGLLRWHTRCCQTPLGNTLADPKVSFIGLVHSVLNNSRLDADFGAEIAQVQTETALGSPKPASRGMALTVARTASIIIGARLSGAWRQSPLFDAAGAPLALPVVLAKEEVARLKALDAAGVVPAA